ncbi:GspH/FimT family pseudopilin [Acidisoma cellulosilytica]|uniref:Type II secretion system protein H n=1 Tax=Acidisoma cellulosilyticum TaxID=2802395 RepID=A0A963Z5I5_9PROT|nr:GspH/FimT family pseudopilin [Acidisoma cellulosilyticum]MCB8883204.1 GspH/FimT family pseudopilin [Acidisoma cellulosilyticum]
MPSRHWHGDHEAGFTLIEMLVVIVILGLTAVIIMASGPPRSAGVVARATASEIVQSLTLARSEAIARNAPVAVSLDASDHRIFVDGVGQTPVPASLPLALYPNDGPAVRRAVFVFAPDGSASGGSILLGAQGHRIRIAIDWLTGRVDVSHAR